MLCILFVDKYDQLCRRETFWEAFSEIGTVQSLIPEHVRMMALTATANKATIKFVCQKLLVTQAPNIYTESMLNQIV